MDILKVEKKNFWTDAMKGVVSYLGQAILAVVLMVKGQFMLGGFLMVIPILHILSLFFKNRALKGALAVKTSDDAVKTGLSTWSSVVLMETTLYTELAFTVIQAGVAIYLMAGQRRFLLGSGVAAIPVLNIISGIVLALSK